MSEKKAISMDYMVSKDTTEAPNDCELKECIMCKNKFAIPINELKDTDNICVNCEPVTYIMYTDHLIDEINKSDNLNEDDKEYVASALRNDTNEILKSLYDEDAVSILDRVLGK